jgi:chromate reductase
LSQKTEIRILKGKGGRMSKKFKILGIAGSLRKGSYNYGLLLAAQSVAPENCDFEIFNLNNIPLYSQDSENPLPAPVVEFKAKIKAADAILIATPEYNYSFPGVLKNAIDWASRPYGDNSWDGKRVGLMGASLGLQGTSRAQYQLRQVFVYLNIHALNKPEILIGSAHEKFDANGNLTDPKAKEKISELISALMNY